MIGHANYALDSDYITKNLCEDSLNQMNIDIISKFINHVKQERARINNTNCTVNTLNEFKITEIENYIRSKKLKKVKK